MSLTQHLTMDDKGQTSQIKSVSLRNKADGLSGFVLDKSIFNKVFEKDVRRVYVYKKSERIAKAIHMISPAFKDSRPMRERLQRLAVELIDAASRPIPESREALSRELLTLLSILSMARSSQMLSHMNADLIGREAQALLQDISGYEDPRVAFEDVPTLASISKAVPQKGSQPLSQKAQASYPDISDKRHDKGLAPQIKDNSSRRESILSVLKSKGPSYIKDISTVIRNVSEKTVQRELQTLVSEGLVSKKGERRWTTYSVIS